MELNKLKIGISSLVLGSLAAGGIWVSSYVNEKKLEAKIIKQEILTIEEAYEAIKLQNKKIQKLKKEKGKVIIKDFKNDNNLMKKLNEN